MSRRIDRAPLRRGTPSFGLALTGLLLGLGASCATPNPERVHRTPEWKLELAAGTRSRAEPLGEVAEALVSTPPVPDASSAPASTTEPSTDAVEASAQREPETSAPNGTNGVEGEPIVVDRPDLVAIVGSKPITAAELLVHWMHHDSDTVLETLDQVSVANIVLLEAQRIGVRLDPQRVAEAQRASEEELRSRIQSEMPGLSIDEYVRRRLGLDPENYRARSRHYTILRLLTPLVVRTWFLENDHALARMIPVNSRDRLQELQDRLAGGEEFAQLAKEFSVEPDVEERGELIPVVRDESLMSRMVFSTPEGTIGGPFEETGALVLVQVVERGEAGSGGWSTIQDEVRSSLAARDVSPLEYMQWTQAVRQRHRVDYGPFLELVGEQGPREERKP